MSKFRGSAVAAARAHVTPELPEPPELRAEQHGGQAAWRIAWVALALVGDGAAVLAAIVLTYRIYMALPVGRHDRFFGHFGPLALAATLLVLVAFQTQGLYRCQASLLHVREFEIVIRATTLTVAGAILLAGLVHHLQMPRLLLVPGGVLIVLFVATERVLFDRLWRRLRGTMLASRALIIGVTLAGVRVLHRLASGPQHGIEIAGLVRTSAASAPASLSPVALGFGSPGAIPVLGRLEDLDAILETCPQRIDTLILADELPPDMLAGVMQLARRRQLRIKIVPSAAGFFPHWIEYSDLDGMPLGTLRTPARRGWLQRLGARTLDLGLGLAIMLLVSPVLLALGVLIRLDSEGPVLFCQRRVGLNGEPFKMYKFRSMYEEFCGDAPSPSSSRDQRITRVGRWLRRFSLDEVPQLFNVLRGEMSLVGPRPEMPFVVAGYSDLERERLRARPGITGLWQISADRSRPIHEAIEYDLYYLEHKSFFMDLAILLSTGVFVIRGLGAW